MRKSTILALMIGLLIGGGLDGHAVPITDGLVASYSFNDNANDESGNGNHGTVHGATWISNGDCGNALNFDGYDDYVEVPDSDDWNFWTDDFSIDFWLQLDSPIGSGPKVMWHQYQDVYHHRYFMILEDGRLRFHCYQNGYATQFYSDALTWTVGQWYNLAMVRNGNLWLYFRDGVQVGSLIDSQSVDNLDGDFLIGGHSSSYYVPGSDWHGYLDEFRIYKQALSEDDIVAYMCTCFPDGWGGYEVCDLDSDGIYGSLDNCPETPNGPDDGTCSEGTNSGDPCTIPGDNPSGCGDGGFCSMDQEDEDNDNVGDVCDNCPSEANPDQIDSDNDVFGDICDSCPNDPDNDIDGDGDCGDEDECPNNPEKTEPGICGCGVSDTDSDSDGIPDCDDTCPNDSYNDIDSDEVCGDIDNCPDAANSDQTDSDQDSIGDECDVCPNDSENDVDGDTVCGDIDNCPESFIDETVIIDGCDSSAGNHLFDDGCTMRDLIAECADGAKNHGKFVSCVAHITNEWKASGLITGAEKEIIQSCAAKSNIP